MKYKVGDRVRIKSIDWYNKNKDSNGNVVVLNKVPHFSWYENVRTVFTKDMAKFCGKVVTIEIVWTVNYSIVEGTHRDYFTDEMIEGLVEDETKPKFKVGDRIITDANMKGKIIEVVEEGWYHVDFDDYNGISQPNSVVPEESMSIVEDESKLEPKFEIGEVVYVIDYDSDLKIQNRIYKNGMWNYIINIESAPFIFYGNELKKNKKEYPKTYEECRDYIESCYDEPFCADLIATGYKSKLIESFARLLICRDAYWKLYGEEMRLGKSWEPDWSDDTQEKFALVCWKGTIDTINYPDEGRNYTLIFPTPEMRDAFYENFEEEMEMCKELL